MALTDNLPKAERLIIILLISVGALLAILIFLLLFVWLPSRREAQQQQLSSKDSLLAQKDEVINARNMLINEKDKRAQEILKRDSAYKAMLLDYSSLFQNLSSDDKKIHNRINDSHFNADSIKDVFSKFQ